MTDKENRNSYDGRQSLLDDRRRATGPIRQIMLNPGSTLLGFLTADCLALTGFAILVDNIMGTSNYLPNFFDINGDSVNPLQKAFLHCQNRFSNVNLVKFRVLGVQMFYLYDCKVLVIKQKWLLCGQFSANQRTLALSNSKSFDLLEMQKIVHQCVCAIKDQNR